MMQNHCHHHHDCRYIILSNCHLNLIQLLPVLELTRKTRRSKRPRKLHAGCADHQHGRHQHVTYDHHQHLEHDQHQHLVNKMINMINLLILFSFLHLHNPRIILRCDHLDSIALFYNHLEKPPRVAASDNFLGLTVSPSATLQVTHLPFQNGSFLGNLSG